ncbi:efflux transporter, RND family, MFP subunit, partial [Vibrio parahaemolyticus V-223/04]
AKLLSSKFKKPHRVNTKSSITKPMTPFSRLTFG